MTKANRFYMLFFTTFILGLCFIIISPITTDDGWNLHIFDNYINFGELYISGFEVKANFSRLIYIFESYLLELFGYSTSHLLYNLFFGFLAILGASLISIRHFKGRSQFIYIGLFILFYYSSFYITKTRPEPVYVGLLYLIYYILSIHLEKQLTWISVIFLSILISFSIAAHPNGSFVILLIILYSLSTYKTFFSWSKLVIGIGLVSSLSYVFLFHGISIKNFFISVNELKSDYGHSIPFYKEYIRYYYLISNNLHVFLIVIPFLIFSILNRTVLILFFRKHVFSSSYFSFSFMSLILSILFLFFNPAKWDTYLVLSFPFVIDFIVNLISKFKPLHIRLFIFSTYLLVLFSWVNSFRVNEVSLFNKFFSPKDYTSFLDNSRLKTRSSNSLIFVQNGVYPLYRSLPNVDLYWRSEFFDENFSGFQNRKLKKELLLNKDLYIISKQSNITSIYNGFKLIGSFRFNGHLYYKYERNKTNY